MGAWLAALGGPGRPVWLDPAKLGEEPERTFPFYAPSPDEGIFALDPAKAIAAGLTFRPLATTAADTLEWKGDAPLTAGPTPEEERRLLA
jgi:2'-hydroxyisoflavone reductase